MSGLTAEEHRAIDELSERVVAGNYYAILGVEPDCSAAELKRAYYDLSRRYHPDRFYRRDVDEWRDQLESVFTGINISFEVLSDEVQRRRYDLERAKKLEGTLSERRERESSRAGRTTNRVRAESPPRAPESSPAPPTVQPEPAKAEPSSVGGSEFSADSAAESTEEVEAPTATSTQREDDTGTRRMSTYARHRERLRRKKRESSESTSRASRRRREERTTTDSQERSSSSGDDTASRRSSGSARGQSKMAKAVRNRITAQMEKAKACYQDGLAAMEEDNWVKAASSLYMAHQYAPKNMEYKKLWEENQLKSNEMRAAQFISVAENAESFRNVREAMENYKKASECDPKGGVSHYRLGRLLKDFSGDARGALLQFRHAVMKEPENLQYRLALADLYVEQNMTKNAIREYQKAVEIDPKNKAAKAGLRKLRF